MAKKKKFLLIDAHALIHRAFHALPPLTTKNGQPVHAVYGFLLILIRALKDLKPEFVAVAFDSKGKTFRHKDFADYKATRKETPDELISQFPIVREVVDAFGFPTFAVDGYEADDLIGTVCEQLEEDADMETIIVTGDMDMLQLVDSNTRVLKVQRGVKDTLLFDESMVQEKMGFSPEQVVEYKGLRGDASDNIPGVKGIGEKGALELLQKYSTIENIYAHVDEIQGRLRKALDGEASKQSALLSKKLATIDRHAPITFSLEHAAVGKYDQKKILELFREYEFKSLLAQLSGLPGFTPDGGSSKRKSKSQKGGASANGTPMSTIHQAHIVSSTPGNAEDWLAQAEQTSARNPREQFSYHLAQTKEEIVALAAALSKQELFAFDTETTGLRPLLDSLVGISFSWKEGEAWYVPTGTAVPPALAAVLENSRVKKTGHNVKFDIEVLHRAGVRVAGIECDTMLASYLLNAGSRGHGLDTLVFVEFGHNMQPIEELIGKGKNQISMADVPVEKVCWYACEDADFALRLYNRFLQLIQKQGLHSLLHDIEMPTLLALVPMEEAGIKIDVPFLKKMSKQLHMRIRTLEKKIQSMAGVEFNVASNVQLKEVLFDTMRISTKNLKKTKTGFSTAASELEKLRGEHPIIDLISEHRELSKLTSTYIDTLPELIHLDTGRIHTSFNQTIAATGRLSSSDPNLQNIPIRTELGREIRKAFIPEKGNVILSLDYSQIELRVVAHLAKDAVMLEAFKKGQDIHARTAAELNDVALEAVTPDMRRAAKAINFGILYGMGVGGIMRDSGISRDQAREFLDKYFAVHTGIYDYIESVKEFARKNGYTETLFGRRRAVPEIHSSNRMLAAAAERAAVNMPVQGTAADIMKLAMIAVHEHIEAGKVDARMLLQVHDELVFEVEKSKAHIEARKIQKIMEAADTLSVPLDVNASAGPNWGDLEDVK